ncbi:hypothetical protein GOP47_0001215 [Adiantum capillus-veneris]|uniref:Nitrate regulatory gene2 protein n=1 Tax=Adiantum capillus-veneris TaxID=13818 RepID=A0A9D4ZT03_ADICA|nr:hypothetical protein GOP47_0001215 [Adiantum capillus-veneris]
MGCATSRLDASDVILQCKERRRAIKDAVSRRQDFAIAHVAYIQALRNVGIALRRFSEGEVSETSPKSPSTPVLRLQEASRASTPVGALSPPCLHSSTTSSCSSSPPPTPPVSHSVPNGGAPTPIKAASPVPSPALPASASPPASSRASHFSQSSPPPLTQASSPSKSAADAAPPPYSINGMGSPDRASDFSPPFYSPRRDDADDYFMPYSPSQQHFIRSPPPMPSPSQHTSSWFMYDIFDAPPIPYNLLEQRRRKQGGGVEEYDDDDEVAAPPPAPDNNRVRKEEGIPDLEDIEGKEEEEVRSVKSVEKVKPVEEKAPPAVLDGKLDAAENPASVPAEGTPMEAPEETPNGKMVEPIVVAPSPEKEVVVEVEPKASPKKELAVVTTGQGRDLTGAVKHIHTHFARACRSGKDVSSMLETQMVYHHLGFVDVKDNTKVFNAITTHWSRKSSLAMRDAYDDNDTPECGMFGSHASTLERLYAWEKKLYDEVKAGEMIRIAFDRKCQQLHNLDAKGGDPAVIDKTRAALKKLDTRLIVAFRAIHLASMRIQKLTNEELYPQLAELLGGLLNMWQVMLECHKAQAAIAAEMQTIENSVAANEASEAHIKATSQLEYELEKWQTHFQLWTNAQKNYIQTLHAWLSKCHLEPERDSKGRAVSPHWSGKPAIFYLLSDWKEALLKLEEPQRAVDAIRDFSVVIHSLEVEQAGELDLKKNADRSARDLDHSSRSLRKLEGRYLEYKEAANADLANGSSKQVSVESRRAELDSRRSVVESEKKRHTEVMLDRKEKTLSRFRHHLPVVFESMASFAKEAVNTYEKLHPEKSMARENGVAHCHSDED